MFGRGEDRHTTTVEDAAAWEMHRGGGYDDVDVPSASELAQTAAMDRGSAQRQRERDDAARARGEYVPSSTMRFAASACAMSLTQRGIHHMEVDPAREGILSVSPERARATATAAEVVEALTAIYGTDAEVVVGNGVVWLRIIRTPFADPFVVDGVAHDNPPF